MESSDKELIEFVEKNYSIQIVDLKKLAGYIDKNYKIRTLSDESFILKLSSSDPLYFIEAQNQVLSHLSSQSSLFPKILSSNSNQKILTHQNYALRILSFVKGTFLDDIENVPESVVKDFAKKLAQMDLSLAELEIPQLSHMQLDWDIKHTLAQREFLQLIPEINNRRIIHYFLLQFQLIVVPLLNHLRKSIIHNDANPMNVLTDNNSVCGIIDFGDLIYSCTVFEAAIAITYLMMDQENPLDIACSFLEEYHTTMELTEEEISILYYLIAARLCTSQIMAVRSKLQNPENDYTSKDEIKGRELLKQLLYINPIKAENKFREACGMQTLDIQDQTLLLAERQKHISTAQSISYDQAIAMSKSALQYMYDDRGNTFIDCVNNIMHVGHCHPVVVESGQNQLARMNTNTRYLYSSLYEYAHRLLDTLPPTLDKIFFVNSGSAASDLAIRLAKTFTKKNKFIIIDQGYHGNTQIGIDISSYKFDSEGGEGAKAFVHKISMPDTYRDYRTGDQYAEEVDPLITNHDIAGFIGESILSCGGQLVLPDGYFNSIYNKVRSAGGVCIADEVQVGFGRVGSHFWGFEIQGVVPDIVIMGKPIGNGHPMAAVATTSEIANAFDNGMEFFSSFGGNPVSCEIGISVLDVIQNENLQEHALEMGKYVLKQWRKLMGKYQCIGDIRGVGLFLGIEFVKSRETKEPDEDLAHQIVQDMKDRFFLLSTDGPFHNVIKFKPPMVFGKDEADALYKNLDEVISSLTQT